MKKIRKILFSVILAAAFLALSMMPAFADQEGPDVYAEGYCVMNADTGEVIFQKDMNEIKYPASITKIMTALVTVEHVADLDEVLTFSQNAVGSLSDDSSTLTPKAQAGEQMTVRDALYGMLLCSANECANALAEYVAGSTEDFAAMMNEKAAEVGAVNTHFVNPHGLHDENHYTTPYDMALIFQAALKNETFRTIDTTITYTIPATNLSAERVCTMSHKLLNGEIACEGAYAGKTGNTNEAGRTLVTAAERYNVNLICVIMKSDNDHFYTDTKILLDYAFGKLSGSYPNVEFTETNDTVYSVGNLNVREFASTDSAAMMSAAAGLAMHRIGTYAGWSKVSVEGHEYYVATDYLITETGETVAAPYETFAPTDAPETEPATEAVETTAAETTVPETTSEQATELQTANAPETTAEVISETQAQTEPAAEITYQSSSEHKISEETMTAAIIVLIALIAVVAGILVAVIIIRRS